MELKYELSLKGKTTPASWGHRVELPGVVKRSLCVAALLTSSLVVPANAQKAAAPSVGTVYAERQAITKTLDFVGRVEAIERVAVQARVKGYLEKVIFKEGAAVKIGDQLLDHFHKPTPREQELRSSSGRLHGEYRAVRGAERRRPVCWEEP